MSAARTVPKNIDEYIAGFPDHVQEHLEKVRMTIREVASDAEETISYGIPTFNLNGKYLIYFSANKRHVGLYPAPIGHPEFKEDLSAYASGKGTAQFPYDKPIPFDLIRRIVKFKAKENLERAKAKGK